MSVFENEKRTVVELDVRGTIESKERGTSATAYVNMNGVDFIFEHVDTIRVQTMSKCTDLVFVDMFGACVGQMWLWTRQNIRIIADKKSRAIMEIMHNDRLWTTYEPVKGDSKN